MDDADDDGRADELHADGIVHFNDDEHCWVAAINWSALRHALEETAPNSRAGGVTPLPEGPEPSLPEKGS
jgi:hypothetical protein